MVMGRPKLVTPLEEIEIYNLYQGKTPPAEIAYRFKISLSTVQRIHKRIKKQKEEGEK